MISKRVPEKILLLAAVCLLCSGNYLETQPNNGNGPRVTRSEVVLTADKYARRRVDGIRRIFRLFD